jgi:hypothetical protein
VQNFELISFASADKLAQDVASAWLDEIAAANHAARPHCVALSGALDGNHLPGGNKFTNLRGKVKKMGLKN